MKYAVRTVVKDMRKNRVLIMAVALALLLTGCGGPKITTADPIAANKRSSLLYMMREQIMQQSYSSVSCQDLTVIREVLF